MEEYRVRDLTKTEENELRKMMPKLPKKKFSIKKIIKAIRNYDKLLDELALLTEISENRQKSIFRLQSQNKEKEDLLVLKIKEIKKLEDKILEKEEQRRINAGKVGGLQKRVNQLEDELKSTKKELSAVKDKLADSMTDKWLRVSLPPVKPPKQRMTTRPQKMKPATRKFMAKEFIR